MQIRKSRTLKIPPTFDNHALSFCPPSLESHALKFAPPPAALCINDVFILRYDVSGHCTHEQASGGELPDQEKMTKWQLKMSGEGTSVRW